MVDQAYRRGLGLCPQETVKVATPGADMAVHPSKASGFSSGRTLPVQQLAHPCAERGRITMGDDPAGARNHGTPAMPGETATAASVQAVGPPRLLDHVRQAIRTRHYSPRTEKAYVGWIRRYIFFHGKRHPDQMGQPEVTRFLSALATRSKVSASTQNQAFSALLFLYRDVLGRSSRASGRLSTPSRLSASLWCSLVTRSRPYCATSAGWMDAWPRSCTGLVCDCSSAATCG